MFGLGLPEIVVVVIALLVLFGAKKIPDFAKSLGQSISQFKKAIRDDSNQV